MPGLNRSEEPGYESNKTRKNHPRNHPPSLPRGVNPKPANHKDRQKIGESDRPEPPQAGAGQCSAGCKPRNAKTFHTLLSAPYFRSGFISSNSIIGHHVQLPFLRRRWTRTTGCACQRTVPARQRPGDGNLHQIERLAELHKTGILSSEESTTNKAELLSRL